jgi:AcrR family transcriptional regulator
MVRTMTTERSTRDRIIDAALELMFERGYDGTTTRAIAEGADVNEVTLFRQFGSKRNLLMAVIDRETDVAEEIADTQFAFTGDLRGDLRMAGNRMSREMAERAKLVKIIMMEAGKDPEVWEHVSKTPFMVIGYVTRYFEEARARGEIRDVDPYVAAIAFFSFFFRTMIANAFLGNDVFLEMDEGAVDGFVDIFINGIRAEV